MYCTEVVKKCLLLEPNLFTITAGDIKYVEPIHNDTDVAKVTTLKLFYGNMAFLECLATNENLRYQFLFTTFMEYQFPFPLFVFWNHNFNFNDSVNIRGELYFRDRRYLQRN